MAASRTRPRRAGRRSECREASPGLLAPSCHARSQEMQDQISAARPHSGDEPPEHDTRRPARARAAPQPRDHLGDRQRAPPRQKKIHGNAPRTVATLFAAANDQDVPAPAGQRRGEDRAPFFIEVAVEWHASLSKLASINALLRLAARRVVLRLTWRRLRRPRRCSRPSLAWHSRCRSAGRGVAAGRLAASMRAARCALLEQCAKRRSSLRPRARPHVRQAGGAKRGGACGRGRRPQPRRSPRLRRQQASHGNALRHPAPPARRNRVAEGRDRER
jgi:hypothetical protein